MVEFDAIMLQFAEQGEKTGWTYIEIPSDLAQELKPGNRREFRVKGKLDEHAISRMALLPMGNGNFIMALNAEVRKKIGKKKGAMLKVKIEVDNKELQISKELLECLEDEPRAFEFFNKLNKSQQGYFSKWIESAKTEATKTKRIVQAVTGLAKQFDFGQMLRSIKNDQ